MKVSIVVPNHGRDISRLLESLRTSRVRADGVFIIDRGLERSAQRNLGIQEAIDKFGLEDHAILWLDSDQAVSPTLIGECKNLFRYGFSAIYIPEIIIAKSLFGKVRKFEREFYTSTAVDVPRFVLAKQCPLFNEDLHGPEDAEWGSRVRGHRTTSMSPLYHHDDISPIEYFRKKAYYGKSMIKYAQLCPNDPCLNLKYRCWTVFTQHGKWKKLLRHPLLSLGIIITLTIRGIIYARR